MSKRFTALGARVILLCAAIAIMTNRALAGMDVDTAKPCAKWRVFLVGVDDYTASLPDMRYAENDVDALAERFEKLGAPSENITVLKGSNSDFYQSASSIAIKEQYRAFLKSLDEDSIAFVFVSGLGFDDRQGRPYFVPNDFRLDRIEETRISIDEMSDALAETPAKFKLLCADISRTVLTDAKPMIIGTSAREEEEEDDDALEKQTRNEANIIVILGCETDSQSFESPEFQHGVFTSALLDAIPPERERVTVREFVEAIKRETPERAKRLHNATQRPMFIIKTNDFIQALELADFPIFESALEQLSYTKETEEEEEEFVVQEDNEPFEEDAEPLEDANEDEQADDDASEEREEDEPEATTNENDVSYANWRALIIGVDKYGNGIHDLTTCCNDANGIARVFDALDATESEITLLTSESSEEQAPTKDNIERAMNELFEGLTEDSAAVVYFSGHGFRKDKTAYLVPQDADAEDVDSMIALESIVRALAEAPGKFKCVVVDAGYCNLSEDYPEVAVLSACAPDQLTFIDRDEKEHGLFTLATLEALTPTVSAWKLGILSRLPADANNDDVVTLGELEEYVKKAVRERSKEQFQYEQTPTFNFGKYGSDYPFYHMP